MNQHKGIIVIRPPIDEKTDIITNPFGHGVEYYVSEILDEKAPINSPITLVHAQNPSEKTQALILKLQKYFGVRVKGALQIPLNETDEDAKDAIRKTLNTHALDRSMLVFICSMYWLNEFLEEHQLDYISYPENTIEDLAVLFPPHSAVYIDRLKHKRHQ